MGYSSVQMKLSEARNHSNPFDNNHPLICLHLCLCWPMLYVSVPCLMKCGLFESWPAVTRLSLHVEDHHLVYLAHINTWGVRLKQDKVHVKLLKRTFGSSVTMPWFQEHNSLIALCNTPRWLTTFGLTSKENLSSPARITCHWLDGFILQPSRTVKATIFSPFMLIFLGKYSFTWNLSGIE